MRSFTTVALLAASFTVVSAKVHVIQVGTNEDGEPANVFRPNQVEAVSGDRIQFEFRAGAHSVTQSSFDEPCTRQINTVTGLLGADSGFQPVEAGASEIPMWEIEVVQDTAPIWMYCNRIPHCNQGMVFAINPPQTGERTFENFLKKAETANHPDPELGQTAPFTPPNAPAPPAGDSTDARADGESDADSTSEGESAADATGESTAEGTTTDAPSSTDSAATGDATGDATGTSGSNTTAPPNPNAPASPENAAANGNSTTTTGGSSTLHVSGVVSLLALVAGTVLF